MYLHHARKHKLPREDEDRGKNNNKKIKKEEESIQNGGKSVPSGRAGVLVARHTGSAFVSEV